MCLLYLTDTYGTSSTRWRPMYRFRYLFIVALNRSFPWHMIYCCGMLSTTARYKVVFCLPILLTLMVIDWAVDINTYQGDRLDILLYKEGDYKWLEMYCPVLVFPDLLNLDYHRAYPKICAQYCLVLSFVFPFHHVMVFSCDVFKHKAIKSVSWQG